MATRPMFLPSSEDGRLVKEVSIPFEWSPGMAPSQKKKNVLALHQSARERGIWPVLEVSSKSEDRLGQRLSAFSLKLRTASRELFLENAFQGSKVFEEGGPYNDLYWKEPLEAKRDERLRTSGKLKGFSFEGKSYPLEPKTVFYDWLYMRALGEHSAFLEDKLLIYKGFSDIEFNPEKSINCQARTCAMMVVLLRRGLFLECVESFKKFAEILKPDADEQMHSFQDRQKSFL